MTESSHPAGNLVEVFHVVTSEDYKTEIPQPISVHNFCELLAEDRVATMSSYIDQAKHGNSTVTLELLAAGGTCLLAIQVHPSGVGVSVTLIGLDGLLIPEMLGGRVLGMRADAIHKICNDLSAARLNSELAEKILAPDVDGVDVRVKDALGSVVRVSVSIEEQLRDLQRSVKLNIRGSADGEA